MEKKHILLKLSIPFIPLRMRRRVRESSDLQALLLISGFNIKNNEARCRPEGVIRSIRPRAVWRLKILFDRDDLSPNR
jgi:hypothetical protein